MTKRISLDQKGRNKLNKAFPHLSRVSIWNALTWKNDSDISRKIRYVAIKQCGGTIVDGGVTLEWETVHNEAEHTMVQTLGERFKIVVHKETGPVVLFVDGVEKRRDENLSIPSMRPCRPRLRRWPWHFRAASEPLPTEKGLWSITARYCVFRPRT